MLALLAGHAHATDGTITINGEVTATTCKISGNEQGVALGLMASLSQAALVLGGTRVLYPADQREVTLKLTNEGSGPVLVQSWIDDGNPNATPDQIKVPFTLAPPLFRLDPKKGQALRCQENFMAARNKEHGRSRQIEIAPRTLGHIYRMVQYL